MVQFSLEEMFHFLIFFSVSFLNLNRQNPMTKNDRLFFLPLKICILLYFIFIFIDFFMLKKVTHTFLFKFYILWMIKISRYSKKNYAVLFDISVICFCGIKCYFIYFLFKKKSVSLNILFNSIWHIGLFFSYLIRYF